MLRELPELLNSPVASDRDLGGNRMYLLLEVMPFGSISIRDFDLRARDQTAALLKAYQWWLAERVDRRETWEIIRSAKEFNAMCERVLNDPKWTTGTYAKAEPLSDVEKRWRQVELRSAKALAALEQALTANEQPSSRLKGELKICRSLIDRFVEDNPTFQSESLAQIKQEVNDLADRLNLKPRVQNSPEEVDGTLPPEARE